MNIKKPTGKHFTYMLLAVIVISIMLFVIPNAFANYVARTDDGLTYWWIVGTGSSVNRLSEVMDDNPDGPYYKLDGTWTNTVGNEWTHTVTTLPDGETALQDVYDVVGTAWLVFNSGGAGSLDTGEWDHSGSTLTVRLSDDSDPNASDPFAHYAWSGFMTETVADAVYLIHLKFEIGDGSTATTLTSLNEAVWFDADMYPKKMAVANLYLGEKHNDYGRNGSYWSFDMSASYQISAGSGDFGIYASHIHNRSNKRASIDSCDLDIVNSQLSGSLDVVAALSNFRFLSLTSFVIYDLYMNNMNSALINSVPTSIDKFHVHDTVTGVNSFVSMSATGIKSTDSSVCQSYLGSVSAQDVYFINPDFIISTVWIVHDSSVLYEQYTVNIKVVDKQGIAIESATIAADYANLVEGSDSKTYKCIQDHTAVDATHKPITGTDSADYWELYDSAGGAGGDWDTGFDYKAAAEEFADQTTDASGDMTEQTVQYKKWVGTSEVLEVRIHKLTISKDEYGTIIINDFIVDEPKTFYYELPGKSVIEIDTKKYFQEEGSFYIPDDYMMERVA